MRTSSYEKVASALAVLKQQPNPSSRSVRRGRGVREDAATFDAGHKLTIEVSISTDQARVLRQCNADIGAIALTGAEKALREAEAKAWGEANREAIEASKRWVEKYGTFAEQLGLI